MIAYNHYIKFVPELDNNKKIEGSYRNVIIVKKNNSHDVYEKIRFQWKFHNNQGRDITLYSDQEFSRTNKGRFWTFEVKGVVTFFWHSSTLVLNYIPNENFTSKLLEYWCLHIVLPLFFTIEETFDFLHAGAVEVDGKPILFIAESFGGKSTMTDYFMKKGHMVISDDKVAMFEKEEQFYSVPSHPHHRPYRKREDLGFFIEDFAIETKLIHVVYELKKVNKNEEPKISKLYGVEKFRSLRYASETNLFFQKAKRFQFLMKMANSVPVYEVSVPWDIQKISEVYKRIVEHSKQLKEKM